MRKVLFNSVEFVHCNGLFAAVHIVDLSSSRNTADSSISVQHNMAIMQVALDQSGPSSNRMIAILDKAKDLYIVSAYSTHKNVLKLGN